MSCRHPIKAYQLASGPVVFSDHYPDIVKTFPVPCQKCIGCALDARYEWSVRGYHESQMWRDNAFLTMTYSDAELANLFQQSCNYGHVQTFLKVLRNHYPGRRIPYMACTEYGGETHRPHAHSVLFNFWPRDAYRWCKSGSGNQLWRSDELESYWKHGNVLIGRVTPESAGYVAGHRLAKLDPDEVKARRLWLDPETGELVLRAAEEFHASNRPGIGATWYAKYGQQSRHVSKDYVVINGKQRKVPRYYDKLCKLVDPDFLEEVKLERELEALRQADELVLPRQEVKEFLELERVRRNNASRTKL